MLSVAAFLLAGCGSTEFPASAGSPTTTITAAPASARSARRPALRRTPPTTLHLAAHPTTTVAAPVTAPSTAPTTGALTAIVPGLLVIGPGWTDDGDPGTSLDLTDPPTPCLAFAPVFRTRTGTALHEFSYLTSPDGQFERGHVNIAVIRTTTPDAVSRELAAVAGPSFAPCAEASAVRRFDETYTGTIDSTSAHTIDLGIGATAVAWRADVNWHGESVAGHTEQMDVVYAGSGDVLIKVRVESCGCNAPVDAGALLPGELPLLRAIMLRLAAS